MARASLMALALLVGPVAARAATKHVARGPNDPFQYNTSGVVGIGAAPGSVTGTAVLQFQGLTGSSYDPKTGLPIGLGQFVVNPSTVTGGATTLYKGTPFEVEIQAPGLDKTYSVPVLESILPRFGRQLNLKTVTENSLLLKGHLDGTVTGDGQAHVTATVDSIKLGSMGVTTQDHATHYTFPIRFSQLKLPSSWVMAATTVPTGSNLGSVVGIAPTTPAAQVLAASPTAASPSAPAVAAPQFIAPAPAAEMFTVTAQATPTPEPSTIILFATAFGGLALIRHRRAAR